jgi:uncharacterized protein YegL
MSHRLPVYLVLDVSGSMRGAAIASVQYGLETLMGALRSKEETFRHVHLSLFSYGPSIQQLVPLTALSDFLLPTIPAPVSAASHLGAALALLHDSIVAASQPGDQPPLVLLWSDGAVSDPLLFRHMAARLLALPCTSIVRCATQAADKDGPAHLLGTQVIHLATADAAAFLALFRPFTDAGLAAAPAQTLTPPPPGPPLPPPPPEIHIVL